ncbi:hypothetical protein D3C77_774080 [compost metagenome]
MPAAIDEQLENQSLRIHFKAGLFIRNFLDDPSCKRIEGRPLLLGHINYDVLLLEKDLQYVRIRTVF